MSPAERTRRVLKSGAVRKALAALEREGRLTADDVVGAAADLDSDLHELFEWDDTAAAHQWRIQQARQLINGIHVLQIVDTKRVLAPFYVRDPKAEHDDQGYVSVETLHGEPETAAVLLQHELARVESHLARAEALAEMFGHQSDVKDIRARVADLRVLVAEPPPKVPRRRKLKPRKK